MRAGKLPLGGAECKLLVILIRKMLVGWWAQTPGEYISKEKAEEVVDVEQTTQTASAIKGNRNK